MSKRRSAGELRARWWNHRDSNPDRQHAELVSSRWTMAPQCLSVESNHDPLLFRQVLVPHELPRHGASDENRTRPFCLDRAAFPPGNLGGNWGERRGSNSPIAGSQPAPFTSWVRSPWSATRESNSHHPVIGRAHCHCASRGWSERPESNRLRPVPETGASPIGYAPSTNWSGWPVSIRRPRAPRARALPTELHPDGQRGGNRLS